MAARRSSRASTRRCARPASPAPSPARSRAGATCRRTIPAALPPRFAGASRCAAPRSPDMSRAVALYVAALVLAAGLFYHPGSGFFLSQWLPVRAIYFGVPYLTDAIVAGVPAVYLVSLLRGRPLWRIDGRAAAFLLLALALGPGLVVNTVLKDHWGRARPAQVTEFGGKVEFTPAPLPAEQCGHNCSFPAGHPAMGFYLISFALLIPERRRRHAAEAGAVALGAVF